MPRKIGFTIIHVTGEDSKYKCTELNQHGPTVKGWQSEKNCDFPQEVIVRLEYKATLNRIQVLAHQYLIPEKIELYSSNEDCYVADLNWKYLGYITLADNQSTGFKSRELKSATVPDCEATFLMLRLFKNHENAYNINNQVSLIALNILGMQQDMIQDSIGAIINCPDYSSPYDDLAFEMYVDTEIAKIIQEMEVKKQLAVVNERFEYARKLKETMEQLKPAGERLGKYELEKRHAIEIEDYERARHKKNQIQQYRVEVYEGLCVEQLLEHNGPCPKNDKIFSSSLKVNSDVTASPLHLPRPRSPAVAQSPNRGSFRRRNKSAGAIIKSSYELYEDKPLPALRHSQTNEFLRDDSAEHKTQQQPQHMALKLTEREKKQAALALVIFGTDLVEKIYSKYYLDKEEGLESLKTELSRCESGQGANKTARGAIFLLHRALRDKVFSVYSLANQVIRLFFVDFATRTSISAAEVARSVDKLLPELLTKSGDTSSRIHTMAMHTILTIADSSVVKPLHLIPVTLSRPLSSSTHPRLALSRAEMVEQLILSHGISTDKQSGLTCRILSDFGTSGLHHPAEHVRKVAERILVLVYKMNPRLIRKQLPPDDDITRRNLLYRQLFQEFDKIDARRNMRDPSVSQEAKAAPEDDSNNVPVQELCIFCQLSPEDMNLNMHYWRQCPMLVNCRECSQVVEISALVEHLCFECDKRQQYLQCSECGEAISAIAAPDLHALQCKPILQDGYSRCPLCSDILPEAEWKDHVMCHCPENTRRSGYLCGRCISAMSTGLRYIVNEPHRFSNNNGVAASMEKKKSPQIPGRNKVRGHLSNLHATQSDSDASGAETNSLSADSMVDVQQQTVVPSRRKKGRRRSSEWEIMEGLKDGQRFDKKPDTYSGFLHKKRKWPLKGWHKRYFVLEKGILIYGKGPNDISRGKVHGSVDIGLSVISSKTKRKRIDIDAEEFIYHLKAKADEPFNFWVKQLTVHRLYRQHILTYGIRSFNNTLSSNASDNNMLPHSKSASSPHGSLPLNASKTPSRLAAWLMDCGPGLEQAQRDGQHLQHQLHRLESLMERMGHGSGEPNSGNDQQVMETFSPNVKKDRKKFGLRKKKSSKGSSVDLTLTFRNDGPLDSLTTTLSTSPQSLASAEFSSTVLTPDVQLKEEFIALAKDTLDNLKNTIFTVVTERDRLKAALDSESLGTGLKTSLSQLIQQNAELRGRLARVHDASDLSDISSMEPNSETHRPLFNTSLSYSSSCVSASEFFDAEELPGDEEDDLGGLEDIRVGGSDSSSEEAGSLSDSEGSVSSESEVGLEFNDSHNYVEGALEAPAGLTGRRTKLPASRPDTEGLSLWNLLCKNIGKDLSQISMPVALNEPLNMLQRLAEELEYSELLDKAAETDDPFERMVYVAAFAVSPYASSHFRAGNKPFNPLLGETYECIREDKGFRFVSEQVSHHPPVSACYADSRNFTFWQDARIKTKFWGKSMEFQPLGNVHVLLPRTGDHYTWNKVTTCVHNLFSGQRWVDQYGELRITSGGKVSCSLTFVKASYWSAKRHEVYGSVKDLDGRTVTKLFGKWSEALYCGATPNQARLIWRPGTMPEEHERYYGFTRFAMELNEAEQDLLPLLPCTDTRFRPDQRALEEGDLSSAESLKLQLESGQRDRRKRVEGEGRPHIPRWFSRKGPPEDDCWEYNAKYWEMRKNPGFVNMQFDSLW